MTYAFTLDASSCSGCKACQEACKDKNGLPTGVLWRRVVEVSGGDWHANGGAWENSIFGYYLSLSCNHCTHPKCAGVCPTDAFVVRPDGIVLIDASKCMGCGYCAWACPYGAPQLDQARGTMTKCNFCYDNLEAGIPPTCVSACPLRVLDITTIEELNPVKGSQYLWQLPGSQHPFPLPEFSRTEPHLAIKPHLGMLNSEKKTVSNREEIIPPRAFDYPEWITARHELPLIAFTLLVQAAAGLALCGLLLPSISFPAMLTIGILLAVGGLLSFLHLGKKRNAWRAIIHLKKSWLSREVLLSGLFGIAWLMTISWQSITGRPGNLWPMSMLGVGLVYSISRVYRLRAVPKWNTWRTQATFFLSSIVLGMLGLRLFSPGLGVVWIAGVALALELGLSFKASLLRNALLGLCIAGVIVIADLPQHTGGWLVVVVFVLALIEEVIGRWQFYAERLPFPNRSS